MRINLMLIFLCLILFYCDKPREKTFDLSYIKDSKNVILNFENNTGNDIVFLVPNLIEFESLKNKDYRNVYAIMKPKQANNKFYQKILDSFYIKTLINKNRQELIDLKSSHEGHSVFYLKKNNTLKVSYDLIINKIATLSKYKQNYYPYKERLKENYLERDYIGNFSKLNFGKAKFVFQPIIKDSLVIQVTEEDTKL